jgi:hypothetical protein
MRSPTYISLSSPAHERLLALINVQAAITTFELLHASMLYTTAMGVAYSDLKIFESQLKESLTR